MKFINGQQKINNTNSATDGGRINRKKFYMLYTQVKFMNKNFATNYLTDTLY